MSGLPKQQRYACKRMTTRPADERVSGIKNVLQNLKGYQLATGKVKPTEVNSAREQYGDDEGRVYGALLSGEIKKRRTESNRKRRRRKRKQTRQSEPDRSFSAARSGGPRCETTVATSLTVRQSSDEEPIGVRTGSLGLLTGYGGSSESEGEEGERTESQRKETFGIPGVIQEMFEGDTGKDDNAQEAVSQRWNCEEEEEEEEEEVEEEGLGFFASADSDSDEEEPRVSAKKCHEAKWEEDGLSSVSGQPSLSTYMCWRCGKVGHLPRDCTVKVCAQAPRDESVVGSQLPRISQQLQSYYAKCRELQRRRGDRCIECGVHSNLVACLDCGIVVCDGRGHLAKHLLEHPSHTKLFSFKIGRMVKCCKASCDVVNVYELFMCSHCLGKAFSQHYSMFTATWSQAGLRLIPDALCCEEHFHWHRMNCPAVSEEHFITVDGLKAENKSRGLISEFLF